MILLESNLVIQLIGFIAVALSFAVFQLNKRRTMLKVQMFGSLLYALHFYLLGAFTGSAINLVGATRSYVFYKYGGKHKNKVVLWIFITAFAFCTALTWQGYVSLLPFLGMTVGTVAFWQNKPRNIRLLTLVAPPIWFTYNLISDSYAGMTAEIIIFSSNLIGMYRFDWHKPSVVKATS